ncbi:transposase [Streptantibioticus ferralitis]|uniref:Transposase n=1 Tax=Streptantibioticus ferralitis TaxID=236510 RepID=A0ABT5Z504_9ACTN|nr:transposase [Streptantibioticus ferralitis]MDF2258911.1 transposase [Streptantibioticus ferralitis]
MRGHRYLPNALARLHPPQPGPGERRAGDHNHHWVNRSTGELLPCPADCPHQPITTAEFVGRLLDASLPDSLQPTGVLAIDSTDFETWARRRSWNRTPDVDPDHLPVTDDETHDDKRLPNEPNWPRLGHDERAQHTVDWDAREGYRSGTNGGRGQVFCGFDLHLAVNARTTNGPEVPFVFTGLHLAPAGSHKGEAGIALIDQVRARRPDQPITEVLADRGYSYCTPARWAHPVRARGLEAIIDLHPKQRGQHPGPIPGTVIIDGTLFTDALPPPLRRLPGFPIGMAKEDKAALHQRYDQRAAYAFTPHSRPDIDGYQRFKGPAVAKRVRCPNYPPSLRLPHDRPTTRCARGMPCACGKTITLGPQDMAWTRQRTIWGTTAWAADYGRRSAIESGNAEIKTHRLHIDRGFTRVMGTLKNTLLLAFAIAGLNVVLLRDWHAKRHRPDPWATLTGEPEEPRKTRRTRAKRRTTTLATLTTGEPPG